MVQNGISSSQNAPDNGAPGDFPLKVRAFPRTHDLQDALAASPVDLSAEDGKQGDQDRSADAGFPCGCGSR